MKIHKIPYVSPVRLKIIVKNVTRMVYAKSAELKIWPLLYAILLNSNKMTFLNILRCLLIVFTIVIYSIENQPFLVTV